MKVRLREQKAITLVALIITIVVLLTLAVVAIGAVNDSGIIAHAQNVATDYNRSKVDEESTISGYDTLIEESIGRGSGLGKATVGKIVEKNSTINGKAYSSTNPVIPKGFMAINVTIEGHESNWDAESGPEVTEGLVISDGTSEFVWIPVSNIDDFARLQDGSETNYQGVLYDFSGTTATEKTSYGVGTTGHREPDNLSDSTSNMPIWTESLYQESFNKMVASVSKYGGFYVGRYETSLNGSVAQSKSGETPMGSVNWYRAYENSLTYSNNNTNLGVTSEMIWGCQWDAMLKFILTGNESDHVTVSTNVSHNLTRAYSTGGIDYTGSVTYNDIASNIYDLEGNVFEWNQMASSTMRAFSGGAWGTNGTVKPGIEIMLDPASTNYKFIGATYYCGLGSRLALYIV